MSYRVAISAGEVSGDAHLGRVVSALRDLIPGVDVRGMGGTGCKNSGAELVVDAFTHGATMGFLEVIRSFRSVRYSFSKMVELLSSWRPHLLILVDYPDFNLRLAKRAKALGIKVLYYIPPKIWAWRTKRIEKIKQFVDCVAAIFPFERAFYQGYGFSDVVYVGNPVADSIPSVHPEGDKPLPEPHVVILAGSRKGEISHILIPLLKTFVRLCEKHPSMTGSVVVAPNMDASQLRNEGEKHLREDVAARLSWTSERAIDVMKRGTVGLLKSGTCNLEAAVVGLPFVSVYSGSRFANIIVRTLVRLKEYSPVNVIRPGTVREVAEVSLDDALLCDLTDTLLVNKEERGRVAAGLSEVRGALQGADNEVASIPTVAERVAVVAHGILTGTPLPKHYSRAGNGVHG